MSLVFSTLGPFILLYDFKDHGIHSFLNKSVSARGTNLCDTVCIGLSS